MFISGVGVGMGGDAYAIGAEAGNGALAKLNGQQPTLAFVFCSVAYDQAQVLKGVRSTLPNAEIVGASTAGEIAAGGPLKQHGVVVVAIASDSISFAVGTATGIKENAHDAGKKAAEALKAKAGGEMKFAFILSDALAGNGSDILRGALSVLGNHFPIVGGSAGDDAKYKETYQYINDQVQTNSVILVGVSGNVEFAFGVNHGWIPVGLPQKVTKSTGAVLHEVDGKPAIKLYQDYLGVEEVEGMKGKPLAELALSYPLGLKHMESDEMLLRAPFFVNDDGSIICAGEIPEGSEVRLMVGSKEDAVVAASNAASRAKDQLSGAPGLALIFSCHVRDKLFGDRDKAKEEIDAIQKVIGQDVPIGGFYTYAEQAPVGGESRNIEKCNPVLHNETVVICLVRENTAG